MLPALLTLLVAMSDHGQARILLVGGHLPICTSTSTDQCTTRVDWDDQALSGHRYRIDHTAALRWALETASHHDEAALHQWLRLLGSLADDELGELKRSELIELLVSAEIEPDEAGSSTISGKALYQGLDDGEWLALLDHLQVGSEQQREMVALHDSRNADAIAIFEHFVTMAARHSERQRPLIAISTASSRDPYAALEFYLQAFEQAGAEVVWLPLDAAVRRARSEQNCLDLARYQAIELGSHQRQQIHPQRFDEQIQFCLDRKAGARLLAEVDGLFLNGGDQWLTLHAFRDRDGQATAELEILLERLDENDMVLGGTSAGAAVQSAADMISNGSNVAALRMGALASAPPRPGCERSGRCPQGLAGDQLTYHPPGGLGSVPFAIVDTHFSERQRQLRLSRLLVDSDQSLGIGVDETTAVEIKPTENKHDWDLQVIGAAAAWLLDTRAAAVNRQDPFELRHARLVRVPAGQSLRLQTDGLPYPVSKSVDKPEECTELDSALSFNALLAPAISRNRGVSLCIPVSDKQGFRALALPIDNHANDILTLDWSVISILASAAPDREQQPDPADCGRNESDHTQNR